MGRIVKVIDAGGKAHYIDSSEGGTVIFSVQKAGISFEKGYTVVDSLGRECTESLINKVSDPLRIVPASQMKGSPSSSPVSSGGPHPFPQPEWKPQPASLPSDKTSPLSVADSKTTTTTTAPPRPPLYSQTPTSPPRLPPSSAGSKSAGANMGPVIAVVVICGIFFILGFLCVFLGSFPSITTEQDEKCKLITQSDLREVVFKDMNYYIIASADRPIHINFNFIIRNGGNNAVPAGSWTMDVTVRSKDNITIGIDSNFAPNRNLAAGTDTGGIGYSPSFTIPSSYRGTYLRYNFELFVNSALSSLREYEILMEST